MKVHEWLSETAHVHTYIHVLRLWNVQKWRLLWSFLALKTDESSNGCLFKVLVEALGQIWCTHYGHKAFHECCTLCMYVCMYVCTTAHVHTYIHVLRLRKVQKPASLTGKTGELRNGCFFKPLVEKLEKSQVYLLWP